MFKHFLKYFPVFRNEAVFKRIILGKIFVSKLEVINLKAYLIL